MALNEMIIYKMTVGYMALDGMTVGKITVYIMAAYKIIVIK